MQLRFVFILCLALLTACSDAPEQKPTMRRAPKAPELPPPPGLVADGAEWETVADGYVFSEGPAADSAGNVYFAEVTFMHVYRVSPDGQVDLFDDDTQMTMGLVMGAGDTLYGCRNRGGQIVRYNAEGQPEVLLDGEVTPLPDRPKAPGEFCNDMAVSSDGFLWFTDRVNRRVILLRPDGSSEVVASGWRPNGIVLSADQQTLVVTDSEQPVLHAFAVQPDGTLVVREGFFEPVRMVEALGDEAVAQGRPGTDGMTVDSDGRFYLASFYGIQVFDRDGNYVGVIRKPTGFVSNLTFGGPDYGYLYATGRKGVYRLKMQVQGAPK